MLQRMTPAESAAYAKRNIGPWLSHWAFSASFWGPTKEGWFWDELTDEETESAFLGEYLRDLEAVGQQAPTLVHVAT